MSDLESKVRAEKTRLAYAVFNTPEGVLILEHLDKVFGFGAPAFLASKDGHYDTVRAAIRDGQRQVFLHIKSMAKNSYEQENTKPKPKISRD